MSIINTIDITAMTDNVLDVFLRTKGGEDGVCCEHLTAKERSSLATALGWERTAWLSAWIADAPAREAVSSDSFDYEGAILDQADARYGDCM